MHAGIRAEATPLDGTAKETEARDRCAESIVVTYEQSREQRRMFFVNSVVPCTLLETSSGKRRGGALAERASLLN